jgi:hypothetical protein
MCSVVQCTDGTVYEGLCVHVLLLKMELRISLDVILIICMMG